MRISTAISLFILAAPLPALAQPHPHPQSPPPAGSDVVREARERFQRGVDLTDQGDYSAAMVEFQRAYELTHNPAVLFNISATHEALHHYVEALDAMRSYESLAPPAVVAQRRAELDAALARLQNLIGIVQVALDLPGLSVTIDGIGRRAEEVRAGIRIDAGRHRIAIVAPGFRAREQEINVAGGTTLRIDAMLDPNESSITVEANVPHADILVDGSRVASTPVESPIPVHEGHHHVEVARPGYTTYATDVEATGAGAAVHASLAWADPIPDDVATRLVIHADPDNAHAVVDGHRLALQGDRVPPGPHELRIERTDYLPVRQTVFFAPGHTAEYEVFLPPGPVARATRISFWRDVGLATGAVGIGIALAGGIWFGANAVAVSQAQSDYDAANTPDHQIAGAMCVNSATMRPDLCARIRADTQDTISQGSQYELAAGAMFLAGGLLITAGAIGVLGSHLWDPGEQQPRFRVVAGLNSAGVLITF